MANRAATPQTPKVRATTEELFETPESKLSRAALAVPKPKKTGNECDDEAALALYHQTQSLIDELVKDPSHVPALWAKIQDRRQKNRNAASEGQQFKKVYQTLKRLVEDEAEWVFFQSSSVPHLTPAELLSMTRHDSEALEKLLAVDTQLLSSARLPAALMNKDMRWKLLSALSARYGNRLAQFKALAQAGGVVDWASATYKLEWVDGFLKSVKHNPTGLTADVAQYKVSRVMKMQTP